MTPDDFRLPAPGDPFDQVFVVVYRQTQYPAFLSVAEWSAVQASQALRSLPLRHLTEVHRIPLNKWVTLTPRTVVYESPSDATLPTAFPQPDVELQTPWSFRKTWRGRHKLAVFKDVPTAMRMTRERKDELYSVWQGGRTEDEVFGRNLVRGWYRGTWRFTPGWQPPEFSRPQPRR